ncbi:MAG: DUF4835 family protein [Bacteroidaceae bacterium]|nr:DUF4835 family protein [Bacteroidaceae bacterium]
MTGRQRHTFLNKGTTLLFVLLLLPHFLKAQELDANVVVNAKKVQGTNTSVFTTLETDIKEFLNTKKWTNAQYSQKEKISCSFNITVSQYSDDGAFECELIVQSNRPVFNASYNTTVFNFKDPDFNFHYVEHDKLEYSDDLIDNNLTAVLAYYSYLIIGLDLDTFAPLGGTDILQKAENVVNNAQMLDAAGWKAFDDDKNRHAIVNDYTNGALEPLRNLMYSYYREGLDEMAQNAERGRGNITTSLSLLAKAKSNKPLSALPGLFVEIKKDELINIYSKGTSKEKETVYDILCDISPSLSNDWDEIKK